MRGNPHAVLAAIDRFSDLPLAFQRNKLDLSLKILTKQDPVPKVLVELGGYIGYSAVAWGIFLKELNYNDAAGIKVYSVESDAKFVPIIKAIVELADLSDVVEAVEGLSYDVLRALKEKDEAFIIDVLFLDHWDKYYRSDLELCVELGMLKPGSLIMADNTDFPGAPEYMDFIRKRTVASNGLRFSTETLFVEKESSGGSSKAVCRYSKTMNQYADCPKNAIEATNVISLA